MARPDIKDERREQILDAFEACVARYGIEGATLARTAEAAGLARPLIRHNIGNREDLIEAMADRYTARSRQFIDAMVDALPGHGGLTVLIDWLFDPQYLDTQRVQVANALLAASADDPAMAEFMRTWLADFVGSVEAVIASDHPDAPRDRIKAVAVGITGIYFNVEALYPLGDISALTAASREAARLLVASLETPP